MSIHFNVTTDHLAMTNNILKILNLEERETRHIYYNYLKVQATQKNALLLCAGCRARLWGETSLFRFLITSANSAIDVGSRLLWPSKSEFNFFVNCFMYTKFVAKVLERIKPPLYFAIDMGHWFVIMANGSYKSDTIICQWCYSPFISISHTKITL